MQRLAQFGQSMQAVAQAGEVARACGKQRNASGDAFDVGKAAQCLTYVAQYFSTVFKQRFDCGMTCGGQ